MDFTASFKKCLEEGQRAEKYIASIIEREHGRVEYNDNGDYDIRAENGYTAEVKFDKLSIRTENIGFEYRYRGLPSGISTSKAMDWYQIFYSGSWVYLRVQVSELRVFVKNNYDYLRRVKGGDDNMSDLILVDKDIILDTFLVFSISP